MGEQYETIAVTAEGVEIQRRKQVQGARRRVRPVVVVQTTGEVVS